ncbi:unnamed protein product [Oppiella nova]|uniref:Uncharacterized protein n=1 Tax=Oppiella nova TaxID=334625 RepID=A0A7R9R275_9ACAR|nr:unnamed protein product [Oppiella nova]CAG2183008.1 unnamed protein product [Oppiella nova]
MTSQRPRRTGRASRSQCGSPFRTVRRPSMWCRRPRPSSSKP